ncbi:MAG TPA: energy-coupling factor ABC transporter permease [Firmicutes bacterium]|nr:energy-coupling factor ABC transporter permease [Bacillota bacterium]
MTALEKKFVSFSVAVAVLFGVPQTVSAMHIMEGYLPPAYCVAWGAVCLPFLAVGIITMRRLVRQQRKTMLLLAMAGAFVFVISSLKIPSVTGSCSHMTGTGLGAILFGVPVTTILGVIVLLFQALLLAHGGLTTLGANTCSMAIAGPLLTWGLYQIGKKLRVPRLPLIFLASMLGDLFTYCVTSLQLALAYPSAQGGVGASMTEFLLVFAPTQLPLAVIEGLLTMLVIMGLETYAKTELHELREGRRGLFHDAE